MVITFMLAVLLIRGLAEKRRDGSDPKRPHYGTEFQKSCSPPTTEHPPQGAGRGQLHIFFTRTDLGIRLSPEVGPNGFCFEISCFWIAGDALTDPDVFAFAAVLNRDFEQPTEALHASLFVIPIRKIVNCCRQLSSYCPSIVGRTVTTNCLTFPGFLRLSKSERVAPAGAGASGLFRQAKRASHTGSAVVLQRRRMMNLETPAPMPSLSMANPEREEGTEATIAKMRWPFEHGRKDRLVRETAVRIAQPARRPVRFLKAVMRGQN